jgi:hypothetical protein
MLKKWRVAIGLIAVVALMWAQQPVQLQTVNGGGAVILGNGTAAGSLRVSIASDSTGQVAQASGPWTQNLTQVNSVALGSPSAYGTSPGAVNVPGVNAFVTNTVAVSFSPGTTSTLATSVFHAVSSTSTFNTAKGSAGNLYGLYAFNPNTSPCYVVFYNSTSPTIGTTTIVAAFEIQAGVSAQIPVGAIAMANFSTGITFATTTTDGGSTVCSTGLSTNVFYQ